MSKTGLKFYPEDRKKNEISGNTPIYVRITRDGQKAEARLQCDLSPQDRINWNHKIGRINIKDSYVNSYLNTIEEAFMRFNIIHSTELYKYSAKEIRDTILGKDKEEQSITILNFVNEYYNRTLDKNNKYSPGTKKNYRKAIKHLTTFTESRGLKNMLLKDLDYEFAQNFSVYLMTDDPVNHRTGMSEVSACGNIKKFRTIFNEAAERGLINRNPFKAVKLSFKSPERQKLSTAQFKGFINQSGFKEDEQKVASLFLFMSLTGCAYQDCMNLTTNNLEDNTGAIKLRYTRAKTALESEQYLCSKAIDLLVLFKQYPDVSSSDRIVPQISNQHFNRMLRITCAKLGINIKLTSHSARHTYRSLLDEADIVDPTVIRKLMGWSNRGSMDSIYRKVTDSRLIKTRDSFQKFIDRLNK